MSLAPVRFTIPLSLVAGLVFGTLAGLIGVGGGEFRLPLLLFLLRRDVRIAAAVNLVVGLLTVSLSLARRWGMHVWTQDELVVAAVLATASVAGAVFGARRAHRISSPLLLRAIVAYLLVVGAWMIAEGVLHIESHMPATSLAVQSAISAGLGFLIAAVSAAFGVAGGEMRIPALAFLLAYDIKTAGTVSLFASIPTVAAGAETYRRLGHLPRWAVWIAVTMGAASLVGVLAGTSLLPHVDKHALKTILGAVLIAATGMFAVGVLRAERRATAE